MKLELNIGLWVNGKSKTDQLKRTADYLNFLAAALGEGKAVSHCLIAKSGEPTVVSIIQTDVEFSTVVRVINATSVLLKQDCIAIKFGGAGFLIGPNTEPYGGEFNAEYWLD